MERDGISFTHKTEYTVIGTMDPREGTLPAHLLDRFGLFVETEKLIEKPQRMDIVRRQLDYASDWKSFREKYAEETELLAETVKKARELLPQVEAGEAMMDLAVQYCSQAYCAGHRADLYLLEAARAIAALAGRAYILPKDMEEAAQYVLPHRMRKPPEPQPEEEEPQENNEQEDQDEEQDTDENQEEPEEENEDDQQMPPPPPPDARMESRKMIRNRRRRKSRRKNNRRNRTIRPKKTRWTASICTSPYLKCSWIWAGTVSIAKVAANAA